MKKILHRIFGCRFFWHNPQGMASCFGQSFSLPFAPQDGGDRGHFTARKCSVCGKVEVGAFEQFGDKQWHDLDTLNLHCWDTEFRHIIRGLKHHKWIIPECPESNYHPPSFRFVVLEKSYDEKTGFYLCKCSCDCEFNWLHPMRWEVIRQGSYHKLITDLLLVVHSM